MWSSPCTTLLARAALFVVCTSACGVTDTDRVPVEAVDVSPDALQLSAGASGALSAQLTDVDGNVLTDRRIVWASSNPAVATVSDRGVVTAVQAGRADIAATAEGKSGVSAVTVLALPAQVASVRITPDRLDLFVAQTASLTARAYDSRGAPIDGRNIVWMTNNVAVAAVSQAGGVTGLVPGNAIVTAVIDGHSATAPVVVRLMPVARVTVTPSDVQLDAGKSTTLAARVYDANNNILTGRAVSWSSSDTRIVTVDQSGVASGVRRGSAVVTATVEGKFGTSTVRVD
jgi:trimeric autotransporter adhesin